jgi:hypothetical protein
MNVRFVSYSGYNVMDVHVVEHTGYDVMDVNKVEYTGYDVKDVHEVSYSGYNIQDIRIVPKYSSGGYGYLSSNEIKNEEHLDAAIIVGGAFLLFVFVVLLGLTEIYC